jgi:hypothetical protein
MHHPAQADYSRKRSKHRKGERAERETTQCSPINTQTAETNAVESARVVLSLAFGADTANQGWNRFRSKCHPTGNKSLYLIWRQFTQSVVKSLDIGEVVPAKCPVNIRPIWHVA